LAIKVARCSPFGDQNGDVFWTRDKKGDWRGKMARILENSLDSIIEYPCIVSLPYTITILILFEFYKKTKSLSSSISNSILKKKKTHTKKVVCGEVKR